MAFLKGLLVLVAVPALGYVGLTQCSGGLQNLCCLGIATCIVLACVLPSKQSSDDKQQK